jgi:hypothetical protein
MQQIEDERANLNRLIKISFEKNGRIVVDEEIKRSSNIIDKLSLKFLKIKSRILKP